jgi:hypothetical protein
MGEEDRADTQKSWIWLARGGPPDQTAIIFKYNPSRASCNVAPFVTGFKGYLQTDGYEGYDCELKNHPDIIHVGCFGHALSLLVLFLSSIEQTETCIVRVFYLRFFVQLLHLFSVQ